MKIHYKKIIFVLLTIVILTIVGGSYLVIKPNYQLNKAVNYLKQEDYSSAYRYIINTNNEENIEIVQDVITGIFFDYSNKGLNKATDIINQAADVLTHIDAQNIDYTLDNKINNSVQTIDDYIALKNKITKHMIRSDFEETYDFYFTYLEFIKATFYNFLDHVDEPNYLEKIFDMSNNMSKTHYQLISFLDNNHLHPKANDIYIQLTNK